MIVVTGIIDDKRYEKTFKCVLDAMDYRDHLDAHYARKVNLVQICESFRNLANYRDSLGLTVPPQENIA